VPSYIITGNCDDACDKLKNTLRASDAGFDARLQATFKTTPKPAAKTMMPQPQAQPKPQAFSARTAAPASDGRAGFGSGASLSLTRRNDDGSTMRSRLQSTRRS